MRRAALRHDVARAAFTATTLRGHTEFHLDLVERHARACMTCDLAIRDPAANANDHGGQRLVAERTGPSINKNPSHSQEALRLSRNKVL